MEDDNEDDDEEEEKRRGMKMNQEKRLLMYSSRLSSFPVYPLLHSLISDDQRAPRLTCVHLKH